MQILPSSIHVGFQVQMNGIEKNLAGVVKNFYNVNLIGILGLGWAGGGKLDWQHYCFEIGASKLFNNSTTFQP